MKKLNFEAYGVSEMRKDELHSTVGGSPVIIGFLVGLAVSIVKDIILNPSEHAAAFAEGMEYASSLMPSY